MGKHHKIRWPWVPEPIPGGTEGAAARERAEKELERVREETAYYADLGSDLRRWRERNGIANRLRLTLGGS